MWWTSSQSLMYVQFTSCVYGDWPSSDWVLSRNQVVTEFDLKGKNPKIQTISCKKQQNYLKYKKNVFNSL